MTTRTLARIAGFLACVALMAGCGPGHSRVVANPTVSADGAAAIAAATKTLNACLPAGVKAQATPLETVAQPKVTDALLHHSSRKGIVDCWYAHGVKHGVGTCVLSSVAQAPSDLASASGRDALAQAVFTGCLVSGQ